MSGFEQLAKIATLRPISSWPGARTDRPRRSPFDAPWRSTVETLVRELKMLDAKQVIVEVDLREQDLRLDGLPRANARMQSDGVVLSLASKHGPLRYACDRFRSGRWGASDGWQHNVRAIALGLEALRKVDRYGITERGEQYRGFLALEAGDGSSTHLTRDQALIVLDRWADRSGHAYDPDDVDMLIRKAKIGAHPDRYGGDRDPFDEVLDAETVVRR